MAGDRAADAAKLLLVPPEKFVAARNARVKELREAGDREAAAALAALKKPTRVLWSLNELARERADEIKALLAAGAAVRSSHERLLGGGDPKKLRAAEGALKEAVGALTDDARLAELLRAAALADEETRKALKAGALVKEPEVGGGFGEAGDDGVVRRPKPSAAGAARVKARQERVRRAAAAKKYAGIVKRADKLRAEADRLAEEAKEAEKRAAEAEREAEEARPTA